MKRIISLFVTFFGILTVIAMHTPATAADSVTIETIRHYFDEEDNETIAFQLSAAIEPKIFRLGGDNPRLVIDLPGCIYRGQPVVHLDQGRLAKAIRTGLHKEPQPKTRVVVDLSTDKPVDFSQTLHQDTNLLEVELWPVGLMTTAPSATEEPSPEKKAATGDGEGDAPAQAEQPAASELAARPQAEKTVPPVFSVAEMNEESIPPAANDAGGAELLGMSFDDSSNRGEMVLFYLNDFYPPLVSAIEKDNPRVLCDFMDTRLGRDVEPTIFANGRFVERIRAAYHEDEGKVRVVLDLSPDRDYDLQQVFFKNDNLFVLIVNELAPEGGEPK